VSEEMRGLKALLAPVVQNQFNRGGQIFQAPFPGLLLSIGFRHLRAEGNKPLAIPLNDRRVAISHDEKVQSSWRQATANWCCTDFWV